MKRIINKRFKVLELIIIILISLLIISLFYNQIILNRKYIKKLDKLVGNIVTGSTAPRGYIYDRNHNLIVNNVPIKVIYYNKKDASIDDEIELAYKISNILDIDYSKISDYDLKNFWINKTKDELIKKEEYRKLKERKLNKDDIFKLKLKRIYISNMNELDKKAAYIYYLMNKGYSYQEKIIKSNASDSEYIKIGTGNYKGFGVRLDWERNYLYGETFKSILGTVSSSDVGIPNDLKDYYLDKGYNLNDRVGTSYLEYQYDDYLKGKKNEYKLNKYNELELIKEGNVGNSIVLTIDINLQKAVEDILTEELIKTKNEPNTRFYNRSFVIINDLNGEILAMAGKQIVDINGEKRIIDYTPGILTSPIVPGSIVKGASHIVGYNNGALEIGEVRYDRCVKLRGVKEKCSWKSLGRLDDLKALKDSSNTYQFFTALKLSKVEYYYDMPFNPDISIFNTYRKTFNEFGLGVKTEIDLPLESIGYIGKDNIGGLLLDFSIGQYDNYTPIQIAQYMTTIANNGVRLKPYLLKEVYTDTSLKNRIFENKKVELNKVNTKEEYISRVKEGFKMVLEYGGTGSGYIDLKYEPAGKTGTSQSFVDSDLDGIVDTETVTNTFSAYAPSTNPKVVFTIISPDVYHYDTGTYQSNVNKRISKKISEKYFEIYGF